MKDYGKNIIALTAFIIGFLLIIALIPGTDFYKKSDILSEIRHEKNIATLSDSLPVVVIPPQKHKKNSPPPRNLVTLEDFSADGNYLGSFFSKTEQINQLNHPVRIAFYGDSFTECEILTAYLRQLQQEQFVGKGGGFVPLYIESAGPSPLVQISQENIQAYSLQAHPGTMRYQGMAGKYFMAGNNAQVAITCQAFRPGTSNAPSAKFYFIPLKPVDIVRQINKNQTDTMHFEASTGLQVLETENVYKLKLSFMNTDSLIIYGFGLDSNQGIVLDNLSLRGNTGIALGRIPLLRMKEFLHYRPYDLIFFQFGLNVYNGSGDYSWYKKSLIAVIHRYQQVFPEAKIILIGMSDKGEKVDGEIITSPGLENFIRIQRQIAAETGICFWNMYEAMGGNGTMVKWAAGEHSLAAKDYTHISHSAGRIIAKKLIKALLYERNAYLPDSTGVKLIN